VNIVLYLSKYGHTKQYASWIAKALNADIMPFNEFRKKDLIKYDHVIFGTGVYIGKMNGIKKALKMFHHKPAVIFACGGNAGVEEDIKRITEVNFSPELLAFHKFFYLPGGLDLSKVRGIMKFFMNIGRKSLQNKPDKTKDDIEFLKGFEHPTYFVDEKHIAPIVDYVNGL
jgi:menaquinone-dependent protoporphyrinogen IX oxidase